MRYAFGFTRHGGPHGKCERKGGWGEGVSRNRSFGRDVNTLIDSYGSRGLSWSHNVTLARQITQKAQ